MNLSFAEIATFVLAMVAFGPVLNTLRSGAVQSQKELIDQLLAERVQTNAQLTMIRDEAMGLRERVRSLEEENADLRRQIAAISKKPRPRPS